jgi:hypothetical protein
VIPLGRRSTLIGLSLEPRETVVCRVRRLGRQAVVSAILRVPIPASLFKTAPERAGQELRRHLQAAAFRLNRARLDSCLVFLPLSWAFMTEVDLPDLAEADLQNFIRLEAERRFPLVPDDLALAVVHPRAGRNAQAAQHSLLVGAPSEYLSNIEKALRVARVRPVGMTFAIAALAEEWTDEPCVLIRAGKGFLDLAVTGGKASAPLLKNLVWQEGASHEDAPPDVREFARQLRITLAQLEPERRDRVRTAVLYGGDEWREGTPSFSVIGECLSALGIALQEGVRAAVQADAALGSEEAPPALLAGGARVLLQGKPWIELMPPRKAWTHNAHAPAFAALLSARSVRWTLGAAGAAILLLAAAFGLQARRLAQFEDDWSAIAPRVEQARALQERVRKYRTWYDDSVASLAIPMWLAAAFPNEGSVWIKTLHVKDRTIATCSGIAANRSAWMEVLDNLGKNKDLDDLQVVQTRGDAPFSFTLTFRWKGGGAGGL